MLNKEKIEFYMNSNDITQSDLSDLLTNNTGKEYSKAKMSYHFRKKGDFSDKLFSQILEVLGINEAALDAFLKDKLKFSSNESPQPEIDSILIKETTIYDPLVENKEKLGGYPLTENRYAVMVLDDSMEPEFRRADYVLISDKETIKNGDRALVLLNDGTKLIREYSESDGVVTLSCLNPNSRTVTVKNDEISAQYRVIAGLKAYYY